MLKQFRLLFPLAAMLIAVGCSQAVAPTELNPGISPGAVAGEYGYNINGTIFDSRSLPITGYIISLNPYSNQGTGSVRLSIFLFYDFVNQHSGSVTFSAGLIHPQPQTLQISSTSPNWGSYATSLIVYDSFGFTNYQVSSGTLTISKFDTINNLISGVFELTASRPPSSSLGPETTTITSGFFNDIPFGTGAYGQGSITAMIQGNPFSPNNAGFENITALRDNNVLSISADGIGAFNGHSFELNSIPLKVGNFIMNDSVSSPTFIYFDNTQPNQEANILSLNPGSTGQINITECDTVDRRISGMFQFSGIDKLGDTVNITNGVINNVQWEP